MTLTEPLALYEPLQAAGAGSRSLGDERGPRSVC